LRDHFGIEATVAAIELPAASRLAQHLQDWFAATERYPRPLHEVKRETCVRMKLCRLHHQGTELPPATTN
jgi:hypothetical protein